MNSDLIPIDLTALVEQVVDQVYGGDEQALLRQWLARNTDSQIVRVDLRLVIASDSDFGPADPPQAIDYAGDKV